MQNALVFLTRKRDDPPFGSQRRNEQLSIKSLAALSITGNVPLEEVGANSSLERPLSVTDNSFIGPVAHVAFHYLLQIADDQMGDHDDDDDDSSDGLSPPRPVEAPLQIERRFACLKCVCSCFGGLEKVCFGRGR